jgi:hypothetical protein
VITNSSGSMQIYSNRVCSACVSVMPNWHLSLSEAQCSLLCSVPGSAGSAARIPLADAFEKNGTVPRRQYSGLDRCQGDRILRNPRRGYRAPAVERRAQLRCPKLRSLTDSPRLRTPDTRATRPIRWRRSFFLRSVELGVLASEEGTCPGRMHPNNRRNGLPDVCCRSGYRHRQL